MNSYDFQYHTRSTDPYGDIVNTAIVEALMKEEAISRFETWTSDEAPQQAIYVQVWHYIEQVSDPEKIKPEYVDLYLKA